MKMSIHGRRSRDRRVQYLICQSRSGDDGEWIAYRDLPPALQRLARGWKPDATVQATDSNVSGFHTINHKADYGLVGREAAESDGGSKNPTANFKRRLSADRSPDSGPCEAVPLTLHSDREDDEASSTDSDGTAPEASPRKRAAVESGPARTPDGGAAAIASTVVNVPSSRRPALFLRSTAPTAANRPLTSLGGPSYAFGNAAVVSPYVPDNAVQHAYPAGDDASAGAGDSSDGDSSPSTSTPAVATHALTPSTRSPSTIPPPPKTVSFLRQEAQGHTADRRCSSGVKRLSHQMFVSPATTPSTASPSAPLSLSRALNSEPVSSADSGSTEPTSSDVLDNDHHRIAQPFDTAARRRLPSTPTPLTTRKAVPQSRTYNLTVLFSRAFAAGRRAITPISSARRLFGGLLAALTPRQAEIPVLDDDVEPLALVFGEEEERREGEEGGSMRVSRGPRFSLGTGLDDARDVFSPASTGSNDNLLTGEADAELVEEASVSPGARADKAILLIVLHLFVFMLFSIIVILRANRLIGSF